MHGNVCILTESRSLTVFSGRTFRKCGHTFPIWTSGSADPAQKLLPHQHSRSPYTSWKYSAFRGLFDTSFSKNSLKPSSNTSRKSGVTPPTYSWISDNFSVTQQVTCSLKCDLLGHILASEAISARGEKRKFWLLCWLLFSFFLIRFFIGQMFLIGIHHISGTCEDARKESMIEVFPVVMVAYGAPEQSIHFLGNAFAVTIPDCIKQSISIPLLRTVIEPLMICW